MAHLHQRLNKDLNLWLNIDQNFVEYENKCITAFYIIKPHELASDAPLIQIARLNGFAKLAQKFDDEHSVTFYVLSENFDLNYQINKVQEATKNFDLNTYWHKLSSLYAGKFEYLSSYKSEIRNKKYIMCVHGHAKPRINSFVSKIVRELSQAGFEFLKADKNDIFQLFNTFFQLPETNRKFTLDNSEVGFKINTFQINHFNATNKMLYKKYCRIVSLLQMPKGPIYDLWLAQLFDVNDVIVSYNMESLDERKRNLFIERLQADFKYARKTRSEIKTLENENNRAAVNAIINDLSRNIQDVKFVKLMVMIYADNKKELGIKYEEVRKAFNSFGAYSYDVNFRQKEAFLAMQPFRWGGYNQNSDSFNKEVEVVLPTDAIGFSYPMTQTSFIDQNGVYLGLNTNSTPMFLDVCDRNKRASGNMCILGTTGSRKSTLIKIMILQWLLQPKVERIMLIDWEGEYGQLTKNFNQCELVFDGSNDENSPAINMFVIPQSSSVEGEESYSSKKRYQKHVQLLKKIISTIILEQDDRLTSDEANILMQLINLTYAACKIFPESNYDNLKIKSWPTLDTLLEVTEKEIKKMNKSQQLNTGILPIYQKLYRLVLIYTTGGTLDGLFNKHTNIVIDDSFKLISFNLYGLLDSTSENIQQAMMLIVTNFFTREMINHRRKFPRENDPNATFINFVVDEFHKVVDDHNTFMLEDIAHKYQQVRKYYCNYIIATPSIVTFTKSNNPTVLKNMQTILDNSMFKFILSMTVDALEKEVNAKLFGENTKLTANEIQYLADSNENDAGKFIFISNAQDRIMGHIDSGNKIPRDKFNTSLANISEIAQLWGKGNE